MLAAAVKLERYPWAAAFFDEDGLSSAQSTF